MQLNLNYYSILKTRAYTRIWEYDLLFKFKENTRISASIFSPCIPKLLRYFHRKYHWQHLFSTCFVVKLFAFKISASLYSKKKLHTFVANSVRSIEHFNCFTLKTTILVWIEIVAHRILNQQTQNSTTNSKTFSLRCSHRFLARNTLRLR